MNYRIHFTSITHSNPLKSIESADYAMHCIHLRRAEKLEISREEFDRIRAQDSIFTKANRLRFSCAQIYSKKAKYAAMKKNISRFIFSSAVTALLSPRYVIAIIINRLK